MSAALFTGWCVLAVAWLLVATARLPLCPYGQTGCATEPIVRGARDILFQGGIALFGAAALFLLWRWDRRRPPAPAAPVPPVTFLIVPSRGLLGRPARYDLLPLSFA